MFRRHACVRQQDQSDCGAAALATVLLHHGVSVGIQRLRDACQTDRVGSSLSGLLHAARKLGFDAEAAKGSFAALGTVPLPAIVHVRTTEGFGHFLVVHKITAEQVLVADPARGICHLSRESFCTSWTGYVLVLSPGREARALAGQGTAATPWKRFMALAGAHRTLIVQTLLCSVLLTALGLSTSFFVQHLVDSVVGSSQAGLLNAMGIAMVVLLAFKVVFGGLRHYLLAWLGRHVDLSLCSAYMRHVLHLPMRFFETRRVGEILTRMTDVDRIRTAISGTALSAILDILLLSGATAVMWAYDPALARIATLAIPVAFFSLAALQPALRRRALGMMERHARLSSHQVEDVSGVETVKAFGLEQLRREKGEALLVDLAQSEFSVEMLELCMNGLATLVTGALGIVILWYGSHRILEGALTIGQLMFFNTLLAYMIGPLEGLSTLSFRLQQARAAMDRLYQILDLDAEQADPERKAAFSHLREGIRLDGVSFRYGRRGRVLQRVSLTIPAGKTLAIVGESGSGKSTLLKLLFRFLDPTEGRVLLDGIDARDLDLASLRAGMALVSQEPFLFTGTLYDNIAVGRQGATPEEVVEAARTAGLSEFIASLPERFDTMIGERGANLSGGQRQRLAIARALLRRPEVVVLDEATSHLDSETERGIQKSMKSLLAGRTVVIVAHRLSTIREADMICVVKKGRIVEQGTHAELLDRGGSYASLWEAQASSPRPSSVVLSAVAACGAQAEAA